MQADEVQNAKEPIAAQIGLSEQMLRSVRADDWKRHEALAWSSVSKSFGESES